MVLKDFTCSCGCSFEKSVSPDKTFSKCPECGKKASSVCNGGTKVLPNGIGIENRDFTGQVNVSFGGEIRGGVDGDGNALPNKPLPKKTLDKIQGRYDEGIRRAKHKSKLYFH